MSYVFTPWACYICDRDVKLYMHETDYAVGHIVCNECATTHEEAVNIVLIKMNFDKL